VSVHEGNSRPAQEGSAHQVAGFLAAVAIFGAVAGLVYNPGRVETAAVLIALIAAGIGGFQRGLAAFAVALTGVCWFAGMVIAIALERPVF
jgi:hypothetical protein